MPNRSSLYAVVLTLCVVHIGLLHVYVHLVARDGNKEQSNQADDTRDKVWLIVVIGSAPGNSIYRDAHRSNFDRFVTKSVGRIVYKFFTDKNNQTRAEHSLYHDLEFNSVDSGYAQFDKRGMLQLEWALKHFNFDYYMRIDDDGVLCLERFLYQLSNVQVPKSSGMLFWGKYHCESHKARADENFMLFSFNLAVFMLSLLQKMKTSGWTFALNVGAFLIQMKDVRIIDDRDQIDAQQGYLTSYMRRQYDGSMKKLYEEFCIDHIWAHHVKDIKVMRSAIGYDKDLVNLSLPRFKGPSETCQFRYSYNISRFLEKAGVSL